MKKALSVFFCVVLFLACAGINSLFAQEAEIQEEAPAAADMEATPILPEAEVQWLWGEVVSVDIPARQMTLNCLDYETDMEKEISINTDDKTSFEDVNSLDEIKAGDMVSVDYTVDLEGKNIAKNISVEKNEDIEAIPEEDTQE